MSEHLNELRTVAEAAAAKYRIADSEPPKALDRGLWDEFEELGFTCLTVPDELGGSGGDLRDAAVVVRAASWGAAPIAEALFLAGPLLAAAHITVPSGPITASADENVVVTQSPDGTWRLSGQLTAVPWLTGSEHLVLLVRHQHREYVALLSTTVAGLHVVEGTNIAGEYRNDAALNDVEAVAVAELPSGDWFESFDLYGATARAVQMSGAAQSTLELTLRYVNERIQFGRPLVKFQAVQHQLSRLAGDVATTNVAADAAVLALNGNDPQRHLLVASAKAEASALTRPMAAIAHQAHGAIGFTIEHALGGFTKRLWAWREEFGNEIYWHNYISALAEAAGWDVWGLLTGTTTTRAVDHGL